MLVHIYIKWKSNPIYPISDGVRWSQTGLALDGSRYARNPVLEGLDRRSPVRAETVDPYGRSSDIRVETEYRNLSG